MTVLAPTHPLAGVLAEFNWLPSHGLHESRRALLGAETPASLLALPAARRSLHRHWSAALLSGMGAAGRQSAALEDAAAALALSTPPLLLRLARHAGIVLMGAQLRHRVLRSEVAEARAVLGDDGLALARGEAAGLHPGLRETAEWSAQGLAPACDLLGAGLLARAWADAGDALRLRADLKLPAAADAPGVRAASGLSPDAARALCLALLARLDTPWLSLFPKTATR